MAFSKPARRTAFSFFPKRKTPAVSTTTKAVYCRQVKPSAAVCRQVIKPSAVLTAKVAGDRARLRWIARVAPKEIAAKKQHIKGESRAKKISTCPSCRYSKPQNENRQRSCSYESLVNLQQEAGSTRLEEAVDRMPITFAEFGQSLPRVGGLSVTSQCHQAPASLGKSERRGFLLSI